MNNKKTLPYHVFRALRKIEKIIKIYEHDVLSLKLEDTPESNIKAEQLEKVINDLEDYSKCLLMF